MSWNAGVSITLSGEIVLRNKLRNVVVPTVVIVYKITDLVFKECGASILSLLVEISRPRKT